MAKNSKQSACVVDLAVKQDHPEICEIAKTSKFTNYFVTHPWFKNDWEKMYFRKEVGIARIKKEIVGFVYVKHLIRKNYSKLHFMTVHPDAQRKGVGVVLLSWARSVIRHPTLRLMCETENTNSMSFYKSQGGKEIGIHITRSGYEMMEFEFVSTNPSLNQLKGFFE